VSRTAQREVVILKHTKIGTVPGCVHLAQRHLEKEVPSVLPGTVAAEFNVPAEFVKLGTQGVSGDDVVEFKVGYVRR
jgi:hypothetical protein